jgi:hypothetical protein
MGTGSPGRLLSDVFSQEIRLKEITSETTKHGLSILVFMEH